MKKTGTKTKLGVPWVVKVNDVAMETFVKFSALTLSQWGGGGENSLQTEKGLRYTTQLRLTFPANNLRVMCHPLSVIMENQRLLKLHSTLPVSSS